MAGGNVQLLTMSLNTVVGVPTLPHGITTGGCSSGSLVRASVNANINQNVQLHFIWTARKEERQTLKRKVRKKGLLVLLQSSS